MSTSMKEVLEYVEQKKQEFAGLPFCDFLKDKTIDPGQRLAFAPCVTPFVMNIWEVNKYVLRDEPTNDPLQAMINKHTYEDDHHYIWFLEDIQKLGYNRLLKFEDALRFIWGSETEKTRQVCNKLNMYSYQKNPVLKLAIIEVIEATGNVVLSLTAEVARELQAETGIEYRYFGEYHLAVETGHTTGTDDVEDVIFSIPIDEETRIEAFKLVEDTFAAFTDAINEFYEYAKAHPVESVEHSLLAA